MPRARRLAPLFTVPLLTLALFACAGDGEADGTRISKEQLVDLVLQPADVPRVFTQFDFGELAVTEMRPGPRQDAGRFGRIGGWKARYKRAGTRETGGPLVIESLADLFPDDDAAQRDLEAYEDQFSQTAASAPAGAELLEPPEVGENAVAMTLKQGSGRFAVRFFVVAWRRGNATASVSANGFEGKVALMDVLRLARAQDRRISEVPPS